MSNGKLMGISLISFLAALAGIVVSFLLIREDVTSTAHTLFEYFPMKFGVTPSSTWSGAIILGVFTSILQVVAASVAFNKQFATASRVLALGAFIFACYFDNWTDVVFRSGNLEGNVGIATVTTLAFYTFGSEITQGLSWLVFISNWRPAVSDIMWGAAKMGAGIRSIGAEWANFKRAATNKENKDRGVEIKTPTPATSKNPVVYPDKNIYRPSLPNKQNTKSYHPVGMNQKPVPRSQPQPYPRPSAYLQAIKEMEENEEMIG